MSQDQMSPAGLESEGQRVLGGLPRTTFTIPEKSRRLETDPQTVTIRVLTSGEDLSARQAAKKKSTDYEYEGAMRSLCATDGKALNWERNGVEDAFLALSPPVRELVVFGFMQVNMSKKEDLDSFLDSAKTS